MERYYLGATYDPETCGDLAGDSAGAVLIHHSLDSAGDIVAHSAILEPALLSLYKM